MAFTGGRVVLVMGDLPCRTGLYRPTGGATRTVRTPVLQANCGRCSAWALISASVIVFRLPVRAASTVASTAPSRRRRTEAIGTGISPIGGATIPSCVATAGTSRITSGGRFVTTPSFGTLAAYHL